MYRKQMYPLNIPIHIFLTWGVKTNKTFTLKLFIQGLLQIYNKDCHQTKQKLKHYLWYLQVKLHLILMVK